MVLGARDLADVFSAMAEAMASARDHLCELDGVIGDADHGVTMVLGFGAVRAALAEADLEAMSPSDVLGAAARAFLNAVGASSGPLYATAFLRAAAQAKGKASLTAAEVAALLPVMGEGIAFRGKGARGDKTMLDAWLPAGEAAAAVLAAGGSGAEALQKAAIAAEAGAAATAAMTPRLGRAARLGARAVGHVDPGAASAAILIRVLADHPAVAR